MSMVTESFQNEMKEFFGLLETLLLSFEDRIADESYFTIFSFERLKCCQGAENKFPLPVTISVSIEEFLLNEDGMKVSINTSVSRHPPFILPHFNIKGTLKIASNDLDFLFAHSDPNAPVHAAIPGLCEALIPGVSSWEELLSELSTPMPRFWLDPYSDIVGPTTMGGVSTQDIPTQIIPNIPSGPSLAGCAVAATTSGLAALGLLANVTPKSKPPEFEPSPELKPPSKIELPPEIDPDFELQSDLHEHESVNKSKAEIAHTHSHKNEKRKKRKRCNEKLLYDKNAEIMVVRATHIKGAIKLVNEDQRTTISNEFKESWKGRSPEPLIIFEIENEYLINIWKNYSFSLSSENETCEVYYHGTKLVCNIINNKKLCNNDGCGICSTANDGMDEMSCVSQAIRYVNYKEKIILDGQASSSDKHTEENKNGYKAILRCDVLPGHIYNGQLQDTVTEIPEGYDSISTTSDDDLTSPILILSNYEAVLPRFIIVYKHSK